DMNEGFNTLSLLYGIEDVQLNMFGSKLVKVTAHHIQVDKVLKDARLNRLARTVTQVTQGLVRCHPSEGILGNEEIYEAQRIVVAGGIWTNQILPQELQIPNLYGKRGMSLLFPGE